LLVLVILAYFQANQYKLEDDANLRRKRMFGFIVLVFVVLYMGLRPISFFFGDMGMYDIKFRKYQMGEALDESKDVFFEMFMQFCSKIMSVRMFFLVCAMLYVLPLYLAAKKIFVDYAFYGFFILVLALSFWPYGTNGVRNGIATSLFIFGISRDKKVIVFIWMFIALLIHRSMLLPTAAYIVAIVYNKPKFYFYCWLFAIPLSLILGSFWEKFFLGLGFGEQDRLEGYLNGEELDIREEIKVGFRWDFLIYSATGVAAGAYYILKRKFEDLFYNHILIVYLIANGLWILIIRANFSNRFAYLSWFLQGLVIIYPLLKAHFFKKQHEILGIVLLVYFMFTYVLSLFL
jgi:hypothetical protein